MLLKLWDFIGKWRIKLPRLIDARKELKMKSDYFQMSPLSKGDLQKVEDFWKDVKINKKYLSLYNEHNENFDPRYIPDDLYYGTIDTYFNKALDCMSIDDKNLYDLIFPDALQPKTIARRINGNFQDEQYKLIDEIEVVVRCQKNGQIVIKKTVGSDGGHGIGFWKTSDGSDKLKQLLSCFGENVVIQDIIKQHDNIAKLHPDSVNSIRILTLNWKGDIHVLSTIIRIGANGNKVDNGHSGGIFAGVDDTGRLKDKAYTYMTGQQFLNEHPTTHAVFSDCVIPNYDLCLEMVKRLAPRLGRVSRLTSWDLSVDEQGRPVLIEVNLAYGGLFFHQIANGPVFGDMTKEIIDEIIKKK